MKRKVFILFFLIAFYVKDFFLFLLLFVSLSKKNKTILKLILFLFVFLVVLIWILLTLFLSRNIKMKTHNFPWHIYIFKSLVKFGITHTKKRKQRCVLYKYKHLQQRFFQFSACFFPPFFRQKMKINNIPNIK